MPRSLNRPVAARRTLTRTQQELEQVARGPKQIVGDKNDWNLNEQSDGSLAMSAVRRGKLSAAVFNPVDGVWEAPD